MFNATIFTYDGITYNNFYVADFDNSPVKETDAFSPVLSLLKVPGNHRFYHGGVEYDSPPQCEFSIISETALNGAARSVTLSHLMGRKEFKPLTFEHGDNEEFTFYCIFTSVKTIYVNGECHGFRLTAQFDSPFARGPAEKVELTAGTHTVQIRNRTDADGYVYPLVEFSGGSIDIVNLTDDASRHFTFDGLGSAELVTVDNENKYISSSEGGEKLSNFTSKNWLRLRRGFNTLQVTCAGPVTITCPYYAMVGY